MIIEQQNLVEFLTNLWVDKFDARALVSIQEAAELTNVHENTVRKAIEDGSLHSCRIGPKLIRIALPNLALWVSAENSTTQDSKPNGHPATTQRFTYDFLVTPGKPVEVFYDPRTIRHPFCLKSITIRLFPSLALCDVVQPSELINDFGHIQSHFHNLWLDIPAAYAGGLDKPVSVADCTPLEAEETVRPDLKAKNLIWLSPDYGNKKTNGTSGYQFEDGAVCFPAGSETPKVKFLGADIPTEFGKHIGCVHGRIDMNFGVYGW